MKNPLTPAGIEPATYRFVAQHLNHCATAVPHSDRWHLGKTCTKRTWWKTDVAISSYHRTSSNRCATTNKHACSRHSYYSQAALKFRQCQLWVAIVSYGYVTYDEILFHCWQNKTVYCKMRSDKEKTQSYWQLLSHVPHFSHPTKTFTTFFSINFPYDAVTST